MRDWLRVAFQPSVWRRGLLYAVVIGSVLIGIIAATRFYVAT